MDYTHGWLTTLSSIAHKEHCCIPVGSMIEDAIKHMSANDTGVVVFLDGNKPVGLMTERDVISILHSGTDLCSPLASVCRAPLTLSEDKTLLFGLNNLIVNNIRRIIVVNGKGEFVGVVTQEDLIRQLEGELYRRDARIMDIITTKQTIRSVKHTDDLAHALEIMNSFSVGSVLVTNEGDIVGILTERDILRIASNKTSLITTVESVMSSPIVTASIESSVAEVLAIMKQKNIRRILITYGDGSPFRVITNRDILRNLENSYLEFLNRKIRHAREVLDFLPEVIVEVIDVAGDQVIQWCNKKTVQTFGSDMSNLAITQLIPADSWNAVYPEIVRQGKVEKVKIEIGERVFELSASYMKIQQEGIIQAILIDITSEVRLSSRDFLTGVYNRRKFDEVFSKEFERAKRYSNALSLGMIDIDHFKLVNDTLGHQAGDIVLKEMSALVARNIREVDVVARFGGEEFVIISPATDLDGMERLAEKLRGLVAAEAFSEGSKVTISVGVAQLGSGEAKDELLERVDAALYRAKARGRNRVERSELPFMGNVQQATSCAH